MYSTNQPLPQLTVRQLQIDLSQGFDRHWHDNDRFKTAFFNALSMSFPEGEQFFINSVRDAYKTLSPQSQEELSESVKGFIGQEATHRRLHGLFNQHLERAHGLRNHWQGWIQTMTQRVLPTLGIKTKQRVAITAAYEHLTAIYSDYGLRYERVFKGIPEPIVSFWRWHASEESEHRAVALTVYRAMGGSETQRCLWFVYVLIGFHLELGLQTTSNLWRDKSLFKTSTWISLVRFFFGKDGITWRTTLPLLAYFKPRFDPIKEHDDTLANQWLENNRHQWRSIK
jgi:predicted metal-dependent hydrolase